MFSEIGSAIRIGSLLDSFPDPVVIVDSSGTVVYANPAAGELLGKSHDPLSGMDLTEFARFLTGERAENVLPFQKPIALRALAGEVVREEVRHLRNGSAGPPSELVISADPIRDEHGQIRGAIIRARNSTELTNLRQRLADIERHQAIGHVAAGIAHDFNNTLQTISQAVAVLQMLPDRPPEERAVFLDMIQNAVRRGAEVISRIRDYLTRATEVTAAVEVRRILEEAIELTRPMWQAAFAVEVEREMHDTALVRANKGDLLRVFTNLIVNGLQAMPKGGKVMLGCEDAGDAVHVWVRDTGHGIPPEIEQQVFNPYFTTKPGGTGLGLSGARTIMREIGGTISFTSESGKGTQFDMHIPKADDIDGRKTA